MSIMRTILLHLSKSRLANQAAQRFGLRLGAERFVAGLTLDAAMRKVRELNSRGLLVTLDHLGEYVFSEEEADRAAVAVIEALEAIHASDAQANVSLKLTQLGLDLSSGRCLQRMRGIVATAKRLHSFVRIDMEDYAHNEPAIALYERLVSDYGPYVGIVLQAYLYKSLQDMERLHSYAPNYRLVKGAYKEPEEVAFPNKEDVDHNFITMIERQLLSGHYAAIATHDEQIINHVKQFVKASGITRERYEFQMLYGIRLALQQQLADEGYKVRIYVPYGVDWYGYFMRRLAERPENVRFVLRSMLKR